MTVVVHSSYLQRSAIAMRLRVVLLVLAFLLAATVVVPVLRLGEDGADADDVVAPAPPFNSSRVKALSWEPRIFVYKGFLSDAECDHLVALAKEGRMVAHNLHGHEGRTSSGIFLNKRQDRVVSRIEERIAAWTFLPEENAENLQVQRYEHGQKYEPHMDQGPHWSNSLNLGRSPRYATVIMYLTTVDKGGETVFPKAKEWESQHKDDTFSECAKHGLAVKPVRGNAVLFFSLHADGEHDPLSLHRSCPVIQGEKWSAPKWIHTKPYENPPVLFPKDALARAHIAQSGLRPESVGRTRRSRR